MTTASDVAPNGLKGWHVLIWLGVFFGVMFAVNGYFLYAAITSFPGEQVEKSYVQGLNYNATLADRREQAKLGWTVEAGLHGAVGAPVTLQVSVTDANETALLGLAVTGLLRRGGATDDGEPVLFALRDGAYVSEPLGLCEGIWTLTARAETLDGRALDFSKTFTHGRAGPTATDPAPPICP